LIHGPTPLTILDASTPSSGKTYLADICALLGTGRVAPRQAQVDEVEFEKRVTAILLSGARTVLIDNVKTAIGGPSMDALLTSDVWNARILGASKMTKMRARAVWFVTGNNVTIQGDLARRALRVYLCPNVERPEERTDFRFPNLLQHITENRSVYLSAVLSIARAYKAAGMPNVGLPSLGSFQDWAQYVRSPLVWLGMPDPVTTQNELRTDQTTTSWSSICTLLAQAFGNRMFSSRDAYDLAFRSNGTSALSREESELLAVAFEDAMVIGREPSSRTVSFLFRQWQNRIVDGLKLTRASGRDRTKGIMYKIDKV
jgi:hypothetical protein